MELCSHVSPDYSWYLARLLPVSGADGAVTSPASVERTKREHTELRSMGPCPRFTHGYSLHWSDCKRYVSDLRAGGRLLGVALTRTIKSFAPMTLTPAPCILSGRGAVSDSLRCRYWEPTGITFTRVAALRREIRIIRRSSCESVGFMPPLSPLTPGVTRFYKFSVNGPGRTETPTLAGN
ncbi:hypothetical protein ACLKA6_002437 [Drosophila palustris]